MLIPQSLTSTNKASDGAYIALKVSIAMQGGKVLCSDKWAYVGIDTDWQMGKRYNYTLDFSNGAGQDADGNLIISGKNIKLNFGAVYYESVWWSRWRNWCIHALSFAAI